MGINATLYNGAYENKFFQKEKETKCLLFPFEWYVKSYNTKRLTSSRAKDMQYMDGLL